jgi:hypothetical protein
MVLLILVVNLFALSLCDRGIVVGFRGLKPTATMLGHDVAQKLLGLKGGLEQDEIFIYLHCLYPGLDELFLWFGWQITSSRRYVLGWMNFSFGLAGK